MTRLSLLLAILVFATSTAQATGFTDIGQDIEAEVDTTVEYSGYLRLRTNLYHNLDLDRGPTPSGQPLFPVPLSDPTGQLLTHADMRFRNDLAFIAPSASMALKLRLDLLDNLQLGSLPDNAPQATTSQRSPEQAVVVRRAYGEVLTPFGLFAAGRMGNHWGLGMMANGGDCSDCDSGDAADRVAFLTPLLGHIWAAAFDFSATGGAAERRSGQLVDLDPTDNVRTVTFAVLSFRSDLARERRRRAGKVTFEYGATVSHRWQNNDVPATYLPLGAPVELAPSQVMGRGLTATAVDGWFRLTAQSIRLELEVAAMTGTIEQASLVPGALLPHPVTSTQYGVALESEFGDPDGPFAFGFDAGAASGDSAFGFGAFVRPNDAAPRAGDLEGPQALPPYDYTVDNFRFHPDYHIDRILFREIVGTVTDAVYVRPHMKWTAHRFATGQLALSLVGIASWAMQPNSAPGGQAPLGVEIDPTVAYVNNNGFNLALEYGVLFPLSGMDNTQLEMEAQTDQIFRARIGFVY